MMIENDDHMDTKGTVRIRRGSRPHKILRTALMVGGVLILGTIAPQAGTRIVQTLIQAYFRKKKVARNLILRDLRNLQKRDLIKYRELGGGEVEITLTKLGRAMMLKYNIDDMRLDTRAPWDRTWRVVMFDIPDANRRARDAFREKLGDLGFYQLQKSVFITPRRCEKEVDFIATIFNIRRHILLLPLGRFEGEDKLRHHFGV